MILDSRKSHYSIADYLAHEQNSRDKHEYRDGELLLVAGGTADHSLVIANVIGELRSILKGKPCHVYDSNLRVRIPRTILYTYPDAAVICGPRIVDPNDTTGETVTNPKLIVEVLSPTTEAYDRGEKFARYRLLDSLQEYVLVSLATPRIETFYRAAAPASSQPAVEPASAERAWLISTFSGTQASVILHSLGVVLPLAEVYRGLELPTSAQS
jgi:Uma2 family endonuclease